LVLLPDQKKKCRRGDFLEGAGERKCVIMMPRGGRRKGKRKGKQKFGNCRPLSQVKDYLDHSRKLSAEREREEIRLEEPLTPEENAGRKKILTPRHWDASVLLCCGHVARDNSQ